PTKNSYHKVHVLTLPAGKHYQIDLTGDFDTFLRLEDGAKRLLLFNNDVCRPDNLNSRLIFSPALTRPYRFIVTSFKAGATGTYTPQGREAVPAGPPQVIEGNLTDQSRNLQGRYAQEQKIELSAGLAYLMELKSPDFDTRLLLGNETGKQLLAQSL